MAAAIVELDALTDAVGSAAEDHDLVPVRGRGLAGGQPGEGRIIGRVHVGGGRGELGGARVDALEHRSHRERATSLRHRLLGKPGELAEAGVGEAHRLEPAQSPRRCRQAFGPDLLLHFDQTADLAEEPGIDLAGAMDILIGKTEPHRLRHLEQALGRGRAERGAHRVLVVALAQALDRDLVEPRETVLERAQCLLQALLKRAPDCHGLPDGFHRRGQGRFRAGEFLERKARNFGHYVVDGGLERRRRGAPGYVVRDLVQGVADRELGRDLGDRKTGRFRSERGGARHPRIHLDDHQAAVVRIDGELHVRAAGLDPDLAQHRDRGVPHDLVFLVRQGERRRDRDRIAGMHPHRIQVLDRAYDDAIVPLVANHLHFELFPAQNQFLDQDLAGRRGIDAALDDVDELGLVVGDAAAGAAERERGADDGRQADVLQRFERLDQRLDLLRARRLEPDAPHRLPEQFAVLCLVDGLRGGADHLDLELLEHAHLVERQGGVESGLATHGGKQRVRPFFLDDLGDDVRGDRLDIGGVREIGVGHDRRRVGIHQHDPIAFGLERLAGLGSGIIELAGLADDDRACTDDEDRGDVGSLGHYARRLLGRSGHKKRPRVCASFGQRRGPQPRAPAV